MESNVMNALQEIGVDTEGAIRRFAGHASLYDKFLNRFLEDENFTQSKAALLASDWKTFEIKVHTLKGIVGALGFTRLEAATNQIMIYLREKNEAMAKEFFGELESAYEEIQTVLKQIKGGQA